MEWDDDEGPQTASIGVGDDREYACKKIQAVIRPQKRPVIPNGLEEQVKQVFKNQEEDDGKIDKYVKGMGKGNVSLALWKACRAGDSGMVNSLIARGANVNWANTAFYNYTPLHIASSKGHFPVVEILVQSGADLNAVGSGNETPAHEAAHENHQLLTLYLAQLGCPLDTETSFHKTALEFCAKHRFEGLLRKLFFSNKENVEEIQKLRSALASNILENVSENINSNRLSSSLTCEQDLRKKLELNLANRDQVIAGLRADVEDLSTRLKDSEDLNVSIRLGFADSLKMADTRRRKDERLLADARLENKGLREQLQEACEMLESAYKENAEMDRYIQNSVKAVARRNTRRGEKRALHSPRSIKLRTMQTRLKDAEDRAFEAHEVKVKVETQSYNHTKRMLKAEAELMPLKIDMLRKKNAAKKIQRPYRVHYRELIKKRDEMATRIQALLRGHRDRMLLSRKHKATTQIQKIVRGNLSRRHQTIRHNAAVEIQRILRGRYIRGCPEYQIDPMKVKSRLKAVQNMHQQKFLINEASRHFFRQVLMTAITNIFLLCQGHSPSRLQYKTYLSLELGCDEETQSECAQLMDELLENVVNRSIQEDLQDNEACSKVLRRVIERIAEESGLEDDQTIDFICKDVLSGVVEKLVLESSQSSLAESIKFATQKLIDDIIKAVEQGCVSSSDGELVQGDRNVDEISENEPGSVLQPEALVDKTCKAKEHIAASAEGGVRDEEPLIVSSRSGLSSVDHVQREETKAIEENVPDETSVQETAERKSNEGIDPNGQTKPEAALDEATQAKTEEAHGKQLLVNEASTETTDETVCSVEHAQHQEAAVDNIPKVKVQEDDGEHLQDETIQGHTSEETMHKDNQEVALKATKQIKANETDRQGGINVGGEVSYKSTEKPVAGDNTVESKLPHNEVSSSNIKQGVAVSENVQENGAEHIQSEVFADETSNPVEEFAAENPQGERSVDKTSQDKTNKNSIEASQDIDLQEVKAGNEMEYVQEDTEIDPSVVGCLPGGEMAQCSGDQQASQVETKIAETKNDIAKPEPE